MSNLSLPREILAHFGFKLPIKYTVWYTINGGLNLEKKTAFVRRRTLIMENKQATYREKGRIWLRTAPAQKLV